MTEIERQQADKNEIVKNFYKAKEKNENADKTDIEIFEDLIKDAGAGVELAEMVASEVLDDTDRKDITKRYSKAYISTLTDYLQRKKDPNRNQGYKCKVFQQSVKNEIKPLTIPAGTLSYIGAMTHRGKTTALISIAIDALLQSEKVVYITTEESPEQIIDRMIKALIFQTQKDNAEIFSHTLERYTLKTDIEDIDARLCSWLQSYEQQWTLIDDNPHNLQQATYKAFERLRDFMQRGYFAIIDHTAQKSFEGLLNLTATTDKNSVVLLDYIQHCKAPLNNGVNTRQVIIQGESQALADLAIQNQLIIIAGGQFGRRGNDAEKEEDKFRPDFLSPTLFRECGDIEQDAHLIIGLGQQLQPAKETDTTEKPPLRFYEILKQRGHAQDSIKYAIDDYAQWSIFGCKIVTNANNENPRLKWFEAVEIGNKRGQGKKKTDESDGKKPATLAELVNGKRG